MITSNVSYRANSAASSLRTSVNKLAVTLADPSANCCYDNCSVYLQCYLPCCSGEALPLEITTLADNSTSLSVTICQRNSITQPTTQSPSVTHISVRTTGPTLNRSRLKQCVVTFHFLAADDGTIKYAGYTDSNKTEVLR